MTLEEKRQVLLYLGDRGGATPPEVAEEVERCWDEVSAAARPKWMWRSFPLEDGVGLKGTTLTLEGNEIRAHLRDCTRAVLMAATLGPEVDRLLMRTQVTDMAHALILDACASTAIESLCDDAQEQLRARFARDGEHLTDRFSPGYGDLPMGQQGELCLVLDTQRGIGLTVSERALLLPRKSVTAILGVSDTPRPQRSRGCAFCGMFEHCAYRKEGGHCGQ